MFRRIRALCLSFVPALFVGVFLSFALAGSPAQAQTQFPPGHVNQFVAETVYPAKAISQVVTSTTTITTGARDVAGFYFADAFVSAAVSGTTYMTVTPQFSLDGSTWANAVNQVISGTTQANVSQAWSLTGAGAAYQRFPIYGQFVRYVIQATGLITPELRVIYKN